MRLSLNLSGGMCLLSVVCVSRLCYIIPEPQYSLWDFLVLLPYPVASVFPHVMLVGYEHVTWFWSSLVTCCCIGTMFLQTFLA